MANIKNITQVAKEVDLLLLPVAEYATVRFQKYPGNHNSITVELEQKEFGFEIVSCLFNKHMIAIEDTDIFEEKLQNYISAIESQKLLNEAKETLKAYIK